MSCHQIHQERAQTIAMPAVPLGALPSGGRYVGSNDDMKSNLSDVCSSPNISVDSPSDVESSEFEDTEDASGSDEETTLNAKREIRNRNRARQGLSPRMFLDSDDEWYAQFES